MIEKEIAEIRRRYRPDKNNISQLCGCYVNEQKEIVSELNQSVGMMPEEETEKLLTILKRTLSGKLEKNLFNITFATEQVTSGAEHRLLMRLRSTALQDAEAVHDLYRAIIGSLTIEGSYMILLAHDTYDVAFRSSDGEKQEDASSEVFSYILCSICPIKPTKPALTYYTQEKELHSNMVDRLVAAPELGFMFPAFEDRGANIYSALYYSHGIKENHKDFVDSVFKAEIPMPAAEQKETFEAIFSNTMAEDCSYDVVQSVHGQLCELIEEHKVNKEEEPLIISKGTVKRVLQESGVSEENIEAFDERYNDAFGAETEISPQNIINSKLFELRTPDVTIRVNPERSDLVETRIIGGAKYLLIRADEGVEVNGINVHITQ